MWLFWCIYCCIVVKRSITVVRPNNAKKKKSKEVTFKNNAPFISCISKINGVKIDNAEDLDVVMSMYNLLEYSKNYKKTTGSLWNYYRDEPIDPLSSYSESFNIRQILQEILIMLVLVKLVMIQIKLVKMKLKLLFH